MALTPEEAREILSEYTDGELTIEQKAEIEKVMAENPELASESAQLRHIKELLRHYQGEPGGDTFRQRVLKQIDQEPPPKPLSGSLVRVGLWLLAALALGAILWWALRNR